MIANIINTVVIVSFHYLTHSKLLVCVFDDSTVYFLPRKKKLVNLLMVVILENAIHAHAGGRIVDNADHMGRLHVIFVDFVNSL